MLTRRDSISLMGASALALSTAPAFAEDSLPRVTANSVDPMFTDPFVDIDE